ncbi:MAG TPA: hypothetical protein VEW26_04835 [Allosphingosinicella sp.]|nr:hypothetical protein [Allosphingosinicella sp.]
MTSLLPALTAPEGAGAAAAVDYEALRDEGLRLAQRWSGDVWTDYNEHDPGVTILEVLCYVLTELGYRAGFPIEDLLATQDDPAASEIFVPSSRLLTSQPVTPADFRRLLIDRVPELGDAWLEPDSPGLYHLRLYRAPRLPGHFQHPRDHETLARHARRLFHRHRPFGEDLATVTVLEPLPIAAAGAVTIDAAAQPEKVMAEILYRLGALFAPEPRRLSVEAAAAAGVAVREGPRLANGLIADEELTPRRRSLDAAEVERHISAVPGVLAVRDLGLWPPPPVLAENQCFALEAGLHEDTIPLSLNLEGARVDVDTAEVRRRLERRWAGHRRRYRTAAELARAFPLPVGRPRDTRSYASVTTHFPAIYGLRREAAAGPAGSAPARQLLGYLATFDRLLVDYLDRLSNIRAALTAAPVDDRDFERPLAAAVPALAPLLVDGGPDADALYGRSPIPPRQQGRLLDFLLALYGESPGPLVPRRRGAAGDRQALAIKRAFLERVGELGRRRGRGFDYLGRRPARQGSGPELRAAILLGGHLEGGRGRVRVRLLEHVLLRSRGTAEADPVPVEPLAVSAIVHPGEPDRGDPAWRRRAAEMIRAQTPAHLACAVVFVDRPAWIRFKRLHKLWRGALRDGFDEATDLLSRELRRFVALHSRGSDFD